MKELETKKPTNIAEMWRNEKWAWIESNTPYGTKDSKEVAAARLAVKNEFIADESLDEPRVTYPGIGITEVDDAILRYDRMLFDMSTDKRGEEGVLLRESVSRKLAELMRLRYVYRAEHTNDVVHRAELKRHAVELSHALFGEPDSGAVAYAIDSLAAQVAKSESPVANEITKLLPTHDVTPRKPEIMSQETIDTLAPILDEIFAPALEVIKKYPDTERTPKDACVIIQEMIDAMGFDGARAVLSQGGALETNGATLAIEVGYNRKAPVTNKVLDTVVLHEMTHLWGYWTARHDDQDSIRGTGMPGTIASEEGKAVSVEQIRNGKAAERGQVYVLASGLLEGTLDGNKRTFRQVYDVMWRRNILLDNSSMNDEKAIMTAKTKAYNSVMRVWRGGVSDTRDLSYSVGAEYASRMMNDIAVLPDEERKEKLRFILSRRVNYQDKSEMALMGWRED